MELMSIFELAKVILAPTDSKGESAVVERASNAIK